MSERHQISRVVLRNYKSIQTCDVALGPLTFLVGPNGAGKSNFVEALRFLSYGLSNSLDVALNNRSGFQSIVHRGEPNDARVRIELFFRLGDDRSGNYLVEIGASPDGAARVIREECSVEAGSESDWFKVSEGIVTSNQGLTPAGSDERLYLVNASGLAPFEAVYRTLSRMKVYNPVPDEIRSVKPAMRQGYLNRSADNLARQFLD